MRAFAAAEKTAAMRIGTTVATAAEVRPVVTAGVLALVETTRGLPEVLEATSSTRTMTRTSCSVAVTAVTDPAEARLALGSVDLVRSCRDGTTEAPGYVAVRGLQSAAGSVSSVLGGSSRQVRSAEVLDSASGGLDRGDGSRLRTTAGGLCRTADRRGDDGLHGAGSQILDVVKGRTLLARHRGGYSNRSAVRAVRGCAKMAVVVVVAAAVLTTLVEDLLGEIRCSLPGMPASVCARYLDRAVHTAVVDWASLHAAALTTRTTKMTATDEALAAAHGSGFPMASETVPSRSLHRRRRPVLRLGSCRTSRRLHLSLDPDPNPNPRPCPRPTAPCGTRMMHFRARTLALPTHQRLYQRRPCAGDAHRDASMVVDPEEKVPSFRRRRGIGAPYHVRSLTCSFSRCANSRQPRSAIQTGRSCGERRRLHLSLSAEVASQFLESKYACAHEAPHCEKDGR